jgi:hypothetical protein
MGARLPARPPADAAAAPRARLALGLLLPHVHGELEFVPRLDAIGFLRLVQTLVPESNATPTTPVCGVTTKRYTMAVPGSSMLFNPLSALPGAQTWTLIDSR